MKQYCDKIEWMVKSYPEMLHKRVVE